MSNPITLSWDLSAALAMLAIVIACTSAPPNNESGAPDVTWLCDNHPEIVTRLFDGIDLGRTGLERVRLAVERGDWPSACSELVAYYKTCDSGWWARRPESPPIDHPLADEQPQEQLFGKEKAGVKNEEKGTPELAATDSLSENILRNKFSFLSVEAVVPGTESGGIDWTYNGPNDDREWGWSLNRHVALQTLLQGYFKTGNESYVARLDGLIRDWVLASPYPGKKSSTPQWRGLEVSTRARQWDDVFYSLQNVEAFSSTTRIMMLSSLLDHADYLRNYHASFGNWVANEMRGLAVIAVSWPEFKDSAQWIAYANDLMTAEMKKQVYPDGAHKELTIPYHLQTLLHFQEFLLSLDRGGVQADPALPSSVERMWNYLAYTLRPNGHGPLNNDSGYIPVAGHVRRAADRLEREDWTYIATNGKSGEKPKQPAVVFPWAGQSIMRSGWDSEAQWSFFDVGPWGLAHQHNDKLHLSVTAFGRDLLVDGGRYNYVRGKMRDYDTGSFAHNVIIVDGGGQKADKKEAGAPLPAEAYLATPGFDYARGVFDGGYQGVGGEVTHTRAVLYIRNQCWVVVDHIQTDRPRQIEALWHFHPRCSVVVEHNSVASNDPEVGNIRITPVSGQDWRISIVTGQERPNVQGWYSPHYNVREPSPTAVFSTRIETSETFAWIISPARGRVPAVKAILESTDDPVRIRIASLERHGVFVTVPLASGVPGLSKVVK